MRVTYPIAAFLLIALAARASADPPVSCANPDNLCTGDPCIIADVSVMSPCVVDFGSRTLQIPGRIVVPDDGELDFTAAAIEIQPHGVINGSHEDAGGIGASIKLTASGDIVVDGRLKASGRAAAGSIVVDADGAVTTDGSIRAAAKDVPGGAVTVAGDTGITVGRYIDVRGVSGGMIELVSASGPVIINKPLRASGGSEGGTINIMADGDITVDDSVKAEGSAGGGDIFMQSAGTITVNQDIRARGAHAGDGGLVFLDATNVDVAEDINVRGKASGGTLEIDVASQLVLRRVSDIDARGTNFVGGAVYFFAGTVLVEDGSDLTVRGGDMGGFITMVAGDVTFEGGDLDASGRLGGTMRVEAGSVTIGGGAVLDVEGNNGGGDIRLKSTAGPLVLSGDFLARDSGIIEGSANGNLLADGFFRATPAGCISLTCTGTCDTSGGSFDPPLAPDCPGSPSGAFLD